MEDIKLECKNCGEEFIFTVGEQAFYEEKGFKNQPKLCPKCRAARKNGGDKPVREYFTGKCARCGKEAKVPFQPTDDRPIYCSDCFSEMRKGN